MVDTIFHKRTTLHKHLAINHSVTDAKVLKEQIFTRYGGHAVPTLK